MRRRRHHCRGSRGYHRHRSRRYLRWHRITVAIGIIVWLSGMPSPTVSPVSSPSAIPSPSSSRSSESGMPSPSVSRSSSTASSIRRHRNLRQDSRVYRPRRYHPFLLRHRRCHPIGSVSGSRRCRRRQRRHPFRFIGIRLHRIFVQVIRNPVAICVLGGLVCVWNPVTIESSSR